MHYDSTQLTSRVIRSCKAAVFFILLAIFFLLQMPANAQKANNNFILHGRVIDSLGTAISNVVLSQPTTENRAVTDNEGVFAISISIDAPQRIIFSSAGFEELDFNIVRTEAPITIVLRPKESILNEVIVTGYQQVSRERSTASIVQVNNERLNKQINTDLLSALEGQVAGMAYIKNPNGAAADRPLIRGIGTFSASVGTDPLIVVDDLPTELTLDEINPYDVQSVTVLKDAAAASIYGARAANGVIVVTTKKGKGQGVKVNANADWFITTKPEMSKMHYATTSQLIDFETDLYNAELARYANESAMFDYYGSIGNGTIRYYSPLYQLYRDQAEGTKTPNEVNTILSQWRNNNYVEDFTNNVWRNEVRQRYNVNISHNSNRSNHYFSFNYDQSKERVIADKSERFNLYYKSAFNIGNWFTVMSGINMLV